MNITNLKSIYSGDELYRQHQDELQKSQLDFSAYYSSMEGSKKQTKTENPDGTTSKPFIINDPDSRVLVQHSKPSSSTVKMPDIACKSDIHTVQNTISSSVMPTHSKHPKLILSANTVSKNAIASSPTQQAVFKKHHLFITEEEVELSINTQNLKPQEKKEVLNGIKAYLKEKGFILKKLLINGVADG